MEQTGVKINSRLTLAQIQQIGRCHVVLNRDAVAEYQRSSESIPPPTGTDEPSQPHQILSGEPDSHPEEEGSSVRELLPAIPGPSWSIPSTVGSLDAMVSQPRSAGKEDCRRQKLPQAGKPVMKKKRKKLATRYNPSYHTCLFCEKVMPRSAFERHIGTHTKEKPFCCCVCQVAFNSSSHLTRHKVVHRPIKGQPLSCWWCGKEFNSNYDLRKHEKTHRAQKRPFPGNLCKKSFTQKVNLVNHVRYHLGERPYQCELCDQRFVTTSDRNSHELTHRPESDRPFKCPMCPKAFCLKKQLTFHANKHTGKKPYQCDVCEKCFYSAHGLWTHRKQKGHHRSAGNQPT